MAPAISRTSAEPTLYEILSLVPKHLEGQASTAQQKTIKHAYHKALLKHHPDKNPRDSPSPSKPPQSSPPKSQSNKSNGGKSSSSSVPKSQLTYTVDQITHAYNVLSDARQRREYDRQLLFTSSSSTFSHHHSSSTSSTTEQKHSVSTRFHTGIETVDLDDLGFDERTGVYFGSCRCGNERGFQFTEAQLEEYEEDLVLMVQCLDCSLWLRVLFDAAEESEDEPSSSSPSNPNSNQASRRHGSNANANEGRNTTIAQQNRDATTVERRGSQNGTKKGKGWKFNFSFNWGISLGGSATANTSTGGQP